MPRCVPGRVKIVGSSWAKKGLGTRLSQSLSIHTAPASGEAADSIILSGLLVTTERHWHEVGGKEATNWKPQIAPSAAHHPALPTHTLPTRGSAASHQHLEAHSHTSGSPPPLLLPAHLVQGLPRPSTCLTHCLTSWPSGHVT